MPSGNADAEWDSGTRTLRRRCLVLDHDDTAVNSTPTIHYPAYCQVLGTLRPGEAPPTLAGFYRILQRGFAKHLRSELCLSPSEVREEERIWRRFVEERVPPFHPGVVEVLQDFQRQGGILVVVSHSDAGIIRRDYAAGAPTLRLADVYGWDDAEERRKPSAYPLVQTMVRYALAPADVLVVDDLLPGAVMARGADCAAAAAGWAHRIPDIEAAMREACDYFLESPEELRPLLVSGEGPRP
jgi:phosphoglycolate phosphatase